MARTSTGRTCAVAGCERAHKALGLCTAHYYRQRRHGDTFVDIPVGDVRGRRALTGTVDPSALNATVSSPTKATCSVGGCDREVNSRGWCRGHYRRWLANGDVDAARPFIRPVGECSIEDCDRETEARGLCPLHYQRWRTAVEQSQ